MWHELPLVDPARAAGTAQGLLVPSSVAPQGAPTGCLLRGPPETTREQKGSSPRKDHREAKKVLGMAGTCAIVDARGVPH